MKRLINFRTGLVTLGLLVGLATPALSVPMPAPAVPAANADIVKVRDSWAGGNDRGSTSYEWRRGWRGDRAWRGDGWRGRHWRGDGWRGDGWRGDRGWRRGWRDDGWRYRHHRRGWNNSGVYLGLGLLGSGLLYDDYYYRPRPRIYRAPRASGHVQWCYSRYRSYRAWTTPSSPTTDRAGSAYRLTATETQIAQMTEPARPPAAPALAPPPEAPAGPVASVRNCWLPGHHPAWPPRHTHFRILLPPTSDKRPSCQVEPCRNGT